MSRNSSRAIWTLAILLCAGWAVAQQATAPPAESAREPIGAQPPLAEPLKPYSWEEHGPNRSQPPAIAPQTPDPQQFMVTSIGDGTALLLETATGKTWILRLSEKLAWVPIEHRFETLKEAQEWQDAVK